MYFSSNVRYEFTAIYIVYFPLHVKSIYWPLCHPVHVKFVSWSLIKFIFMIYGIGIGIEHYVWQQGKRMQLSFTSLV